MLYGFHMGLGHQWQKPKVASPTGRGSCPSHHYEIGWLICFQKSTCFVANSKGPQTNFGFAPFAPSTRAAGTPAIAEASGAYVAGASIRNLGSMGAKSFDALNADGAESSKKDGDGNGSLVRTETTSTDLKTPPIDSQWRLEVSPPAGVKKPCPHLPAGSPTPEMPKSKTPTESPKSSAPSCGKKYDKYYHACPREIHVARA